ncbi:hypothetical protein BV898_17451 [Hypsibius exemplaris]|uniref:Peptidase M12A domain-containing protein n=1 Tax=Hypsibius exemplaris TaxID=2072580 RepID=A0A9X6RM65_HYPEX|nr:hypothetical protein BV898_17451 [Hypsibius exemplaris]
MHYGKTAYAKDGFSWTIRPKRQYAAYEAIMGQRNSLSQIDIGKINTMYKCPNTGGAKPTDPMPPPPHPRDVQPQRHTTQAAAINEQDDDDEDVPTVEATTRKMSTPRTHRLKRSTTHLPARVTVTQTADDGQLIDDRFSEMVTKTPTTSHAGVLLFGSLNVSTHPALATAIMVSATDLIRRVRSLVEMTNSVVDNVDSSGALTCESVTAMDAAPLPEYHDPWKIHRTPGLGEGSLYAITM